MSDEIFGRADAVAKKHGFTQTAEPEKQVTRRRRTKGPLRVLNVSMPEAEYERFVKYADKADLPYWSALVKLMDEAEEKGV